MTMQETVQQFIDEITECHLEKLRAEDEKYQEMRADLLKLSKEVRTHINTLSESQKKVLMDYSDTRGNQEYANCQYLYLAGVKDAVRVLKFLKVI